MSSTAPIKNTANSKNRSRNDSRIEESLRQDIMKKCAARDKGDGKNIFGSFAAIYADSINPDDLRDQSDVDFFVNAAAQLWDTAIARKGRKPAIAIDMPSAKNPGAKNLGVNNWPIISIISDDMPFLVDSTTGELHRLGLQIHAVVHPTAYVEKTGDKITAIHPPRHVQKTPEPKSTGQRVSFIQFAVKNPASDIDAKTVKESLLQVLNDVDCAVRDWQSMRKKLAGIIAEMPAGIPSPAEREEARRFLEWLDQDHFTFLGYRCYDYPKLNSKGHIDVVSGSGLGLIADESIRVFGDLRDRDANHPELKDFISDTAIISVSKSNTPSRVHRTVPMDVISIKRYGESGRVVGEHRFVGLFTSLAYSRNPRDIPMLRQKVENIVKRSGWSPQGHMAKILVDVLVSFPRDELVQIGEDELFQIAMGITRVQEKIRTALFVRRDKFGRYYSCLIYTPRETFTSDLRHKFGTILENRLGGKIRNYYTQLSDHLLARIHFIVDCPQTATSGAKLDLAAIESELAESARSWADRLREAAIKKFGEAKAIPMLRRYANAFSEGYQKMFPLADALADMEWVDVALAATPGNTGFVAHIYPRGDASRGECGIALYQRGKQLPLSDILPSLENMGFRVISEMAIAITPEHDGQTGTVWSHDIAVERLDGQSISVDAIREKFVAAMSGVRSGAFEDDGFNRLVISNGMSAREVVVFRTYAKYLRQAGFTISQSSIEKCLSKHAGITHDLLALFYAAFDPDMKNRTNVSARIRAEILEKLERVTNVDEDRILRKYLNLIQSTLRTNFFQTMPDGAPKNYLSVKLSSHDIDDLPEPKPWCEIFVCSPRVEAIHLRGGKVARGGIRWSDRREDFRTEILGLVKAQIVKNTVIVPVGSKGGFVLKQPPADKKLLNAEVVDCYKTMMRGLLDITDNLKSGKIVPPKNVVRRDGDDPYLVVAADKGTAKFSDTANSISAEYDFWLGDAFASGGSAGYDHKELAITSRGGWVAVMRHFREMGVDIRNQEFTVTGVGDMAGDVFGNGMLRSDKMRLIAAFNHSHIFIDPNPDPAKSFKERKRLFENPQLTWADYGANILSKGGAVYTRDQKKIALSAEARKALDITETECTPAALMQHILRAPSDLLWLGGIGTFVKSISENNADAGDRANDNLRINGRDLRCKIVGEGANLGFTQLGRIEYAMAGGRNNTDAIDNSAGVDTSDHEVNIKILLSGIEQSGKLTRKDRDQLLRSMSADVCDLVLRDNYEQTMILSVMAPETPARLDDYARHIKTLERAAKLNRAIEYLPSDEQLADRAISRGGKKSGLTRPELAVMLAYTKMALYDQLLASDLPDDPALQSDLMSYFPPALQKKYSKEIEKHPLRREIIATVLTNYIVNRTGVLFTHGIADMTGNSIADIARAYIAVREIFGLDSVWRDICALDYKTKPDVQIDMIHALNRFVERATIWFLRQRKGKQTLAQILDMYQKPVRQIETGLRDTLPDHDLRILDHKVKDYTAQHVPQKLAQTVIFSRMLGGVGDVINIADSTKKPAAGVAEIYFICGERFGLDWMRRMASKLPGNSAWQNRATSSVIEDLLGLQARLTKEIVRKNGTGAGAVQKFLGENKTALDPIDQLLAEIRAASALDTAMITVAIAKIRTLLM